MSGRGVLCPRLELKWEPSNALLMHHSVILSGSASAVQHTHTHTHACTEGERHLTRYVTCRSVGVVVSEFGHGWACKTASRADCSGHCGGTDSQNTGRQSGSMAAWQDRGCDAPPLITSDLVVSPFQVELPSDVTALGNGTRCSAIIYVKVSVDVCFSATLLCRQCRGGSWSQANGCRRGSLQSDCRVHPADFRLTWQDREARLSLFSGAVGPVGSVETSLRFSWKLLICLAAAALSRLPLPTMTSTPGPRNPKYFVEPAIAGTFHDWRTCAMCCLL